MPVKNLICVGYSYPTEPAWADVFANADQIKAVVLNPNNGVGSPDGNYASLVLRLKSVGILVLGYVYVGSGPIGGTRVYSNRPPAEVRSEIETWLNRYQVDGFFFDEVSTDPATIPYMRRAAGTARSLRQDAFLVFNHGAIPDPGFVPLADVLCRFESQAGKYLSATFPSWMFNWSPDHFLDIVSGVTLDNSASVLAKVKSAGDGYRYLCSAQGQDPQYGVETTVWETEPTRPVVPKVVGQVENDLGQMVQLLLEIAKITGYPLSDTPGVNTLIGLPAHVRTKLKV